jgi:hypothetical protein
MKSRNKVSDNVADYIGLAHDLVNSVFFGDNATDEYGNQLVRIAKDGKEFVVHEPALIKEIVGIVVGGTAMRDENGIPQTDENGKTLKNPGLLDKSLVKCLTKEDIK